MNKTDKINKNTKRKSYSKALKRKILLDIINGKKPQDAFLEYATEPIEQISSDKKYVLKLIHKWKKEVYENKELMYLVNQNITSELLEDEIEIMDEIKNEENDFFKQDYCNWYNY